MSSRPVEILLLIRDGVNDWPALCKRFQLDPQAMDAPQGMLIDTLIALSRVELVNLNRTQAELWYRTEGLTFTVSREWLGLQSVDVSGEPTDIFVMTAFEHDQQSVHKNHIVPVAESLRLKVRQADDCYDTQATLTSIWNPLMASRICIGDCTARDPNVFYEMGVAHVLDRPLVLIARSAMDIHADLRQVRHILYDMTPPGMKAFEETLRATLVQEFHLDKNR